MSVAGAALCILNGAAHSKGAQARREEVETALRKQPRPVDIVVAEEGVDIGELAREALKRGVKLLIGAGGDGTINAVASAVAGTDNRLGVLPLGTLNHFARDLGIPLGIDEAVTTVFAGREKHVDVGEVNGRIFLNNSSLGLYPGIVVTREALERQGHGKWTAFVEAVGYMLRTYSSLTVETKLDGATDVTTTPFIFVGNNRYHVTAPRLGERDSLEEERLWVYQAPHASQLGLVLLALRALLGIRNPVELIERDASGFEVRAARALRVSTDGEVTTMASPLRYLSRPKALRVMVPGAATAGKDT